MKNETDALNTAIIALKEQRARELVLLKEHLQVTYESLAPINLIKSTLKEVSSSPDIKNSIAGSAIGIGTGFLFKRLWVGSSHNPFKRLLGTVIQFGITNVLSKHADDIKTLGENLLARYLAHRQESNGELHHNGNDLRIH